MQPARRLLASTGAGGAAMRLGAFTCRGCLARQAAARQCRAFSRSAPRHAALPKPSRSGLAFLASRKLISISGPDAAKYLQGVITANILTGPPGPNQHVRTDPGFYAAFLTAQGRVLHDVFIYPDVRDPSKNPGESWLLEVDASEAERLQKHIKRYKLRAKFDVRVLDEGEGSVWHAWNDDAAAADTSAPPPPSPSLSSAATKTNGTLITLRDTRARGLGYRIITLNGGPTPPPPPPPPPSVVDLADLPQVPEEAYRIRRYLHGVPEGQAELPREQALPHESNLDAMGAVDFRKGCYVGQELTVRTEHRGVVRKRVLPCLLYPDDDGSQQGVPERRRLECRPGIIGTDGEEEVITAEMIPAGASIARVGKKGRSAGKWLSGVGNLGLALCRLEIMTDVVLPGEKTAGGVGFDPADEFVVGLGKAGERGEGEDGEGKKVKIKAFVPDWLREKLTMKASH
ncbi:hypothetical protein VTK56DRAFT_7692 [Thermocarpiscus australiensis]